MYIKISSRMRVRLRYFATCLMVSWVVMTILYLLPLFISSRSEEKVVRELETIQSIKFDILCTSSSFLKCFLQSKFIIKYPPSTHSGTVEPQLSVSDETEALPHNLPNIKVKYQIREVCMRTIVSNIHLHCSTF